MRGFPGGWVAQTLSLQCRGPGLIPGQAARSHMPQLRVLTWAWRPGAAKQTQPASSQQAKEPTVRWHRKPSRIAEGGKDNTDEDMGKLEFSRTVGRSGKWYSHSAQVFSTSLQPFNQQLHSWGLTTEKWKHISPQGLVHECLPQLYLK